MMANEPADDHERRAPRVRRDRARLSFACMAVLLTAADTYVVVLALPAIMGDIGIDLAHLQRATPIISGFLLGYVAMLPLLGRLADLYGRRRVFVACLGCFAVGSLVTASAQGLGGVVVGRTLQGLGGGGLVPVTLALVADMWSSERRGFPLGVVGAVQEVGGIMGPLYGAAIVTVSSWRTLFWINLPLSAALAVGFAMSQPHAGRTRSAAHPGHPQEPLPDVIGSILLLVLVIATGLAVAAPPALTSSDLWGTLYAPLLYPPWLPGGSPTLTPIGLVVIATGCMNAVWGTTPPGRMRRLLPIRRLGDVARRADWLGSLLLAGVLACVVASFATADNAVVLIPPAARGLLPLGVALAMAFVLWERRHPDPLIDFADFADRAAGGALVANLAIGAALMATLVDIPVFARTTTFPGSQFGAATVLIRLLIGIPFGALLGGAICDRLSYRATAAAGMALCTGGLLVIAGWTSTALTGPGLGGSAIRWSDVTLALCGVGFGLAIAPINAAILAVVPPTRHGLAAALVVVARMVGMLTGLGVLTAVGLHELYVAQSRLPSPASICPTTPIRCPGYDRIVENAIITEMHTIFTGAALAAAVGGVLALGLLRRPRHG